MLAPIGKRIIVQPVEVKQTGSLVITGIKPTQFKIIAAGDEVTKVKLGDIVYLGKYSGVEIEHEREVFIVVEEEGVLAKVS